MNNKTSESGHTEILQYLIEEYAIDSYYCVLAAIKGGFLDIVEYLIEIGIEIGLKMDILEFCRYAIDQNQFDILKCLHENGFAWGESTFSRAAAKGNFQILGYLHENKCPWGDWFIHCAICDNENQDVITWLSERGYSRSGEICEYCD